MISPRFEWANDFHSGLAAVNRTKDCGYIDKSGAFVFHLPDPGNDHSCTTKWTEFKEGLAPSLFGAKFGFIDQTGKTVIQPQFDWAEGFSDGVAGRADQSQMGICRSIPKIALPT
jgi:hypothetical protein